MKKEEYIPGGNAVISMVNQNHACHLGRVPVVIMHEAEAQQLMEQAFRKQKPVAAEPTRESLILQLCHGLIPVGICAAWILGAMEGLADPVFTGVLTAACAGWAAVEWKWGKFNAEN